MPKELEETQVDHRAAANALLSQASETPAEEEHVPVIVQEALVHSQLAVADELKGIREALGSDLQVEKKPGLLWRKTRGGK